MSSAAAFNNSSAAASSAASSSSRLRQMSAESAASVRAGTVIGSLGRCVEELVRNAASAGAKTVTVVVGGSSGSGGAGAGAGGTSGGASMESSDTNSASASAASSVLTVQDDGIGIDPASLRRYVGTDHCSSWGLAGSGSSSSRGGLQLSAAAASSVGLFAERGESLRSVAALSVEMRIVSHSSSAVTNGEAATVDNASRRHSLPTAGEKKRRTATAAATTGTTYYQQQPQEQQQGVVRCEKVIREGRAVSFSSSSAGTDTSLKDGSSSSSSSILPPALSLSGGGGAGTAGGGKRSRLSLGSSSITTTTSGAGGDGACLHHRSSQQQQQLQTGTAVTVVGLFHRYAVRRRHQERAAGGGDRARGGARTAAAATTGATTGSSTASSSAAADLSQARNCLRGMALAHPLLAFRLVDGRTGTVDSSWGGAAAAAASAGNRRGGSNTSTTMSTTAAGTACTSSSVASTSRSRFDPSLPLSASFSARRGGADGTTSTSGSDDAADDTAGRLVDSLSRRFRQHCGEATLKNHRMVGMVYDEEVNSATSHAGSITSSSSSIAHARRRHSSRMPWSVLGVLCIGSATDDDSFGDDDNRNGQLQQQQQKKMTRTTRTRQHELVFINRRPARHNNALSAIVQDEISSFLPPQEDGQASLSSSFVVHATVAPRDVDLIIDEHRSSLAVPQRERMERLLRKAVASTMRNNGFSRRRAPQQSDQGVSGRRHRGQFRQQSQMRSSSRHAGGRSLFDPSSVLGSVSGNDSASMPSVGSIASSKIISGEVVVKKPSSALPSSPYFSSSSDRANSCSSDNADAENNPPQEDSSSMIKSSSASPFSDAFLSGQPMTDLARKDPPSICFEEAFFSSEATGGDNVAGSETATSNDSVEVEMQPQPSWTRTRLRALESQISSLAVDPATAARGQGTRRPAPPMTLSKEMIAKSSVVAQVDDKFIVINAGGLLCIVDQHAASERVGLERLERRLIAETASQENGGNQQAPLLRSVPLLPAQAIPLSPGQFAVVQQNKHLLSQWRFTVDLPAHPSEPLLLKGVPGISDKLATRQDFLQYLQALESRSSDAALVTPAFIKRTIASQACRYAIMFGDPLSHEAQKSLIEDVSKCHLPFICAHGRPSIVPLLSLENLGEE